MELNDSFASHDPAVIGASIFDDVVATPFVYVDIAKARANIEAMAVRTRAAGLHLRPHVKTHKLAAIARWQLEAGAVGLTVAKLGEAEAMVDAGVNSSYLVAHPFWNQAQIDRFLSLQRRCNLIASVDSRESAERLSHAAQSASASITVSLIIDTGYGRFGVAPDRGLAVGQAIALLPALRLTAIRSHAGHAYAQRDREARRKIVIDEVAAMTRVATELRAAGVGIETVSVGSTPGSAALIECVDHGAVTEARPGNYVFFDRQQISMGVASEDECAIAIVSTVVSAPRARVVILDAGRLTFSSATDPFANGYGLVSDHPAARIVALSQEAATVETDGSSLQLGTRVSVIPNHACEITNLAPHVFYGTNNRIEGVWRPEAGQRTR